MESHLPYILSITTSHGCRYCRHDKQDDGHLDQTYEYVAYELYIGGPRPDQRTEYDATDRGNQYLCRE